MEEQHDKDNSATAPGVGDHVDQTDPAMDTADNPPPLSRKEAQLKTTVITIYALQAIGFLIGITWIIALVISYIKREEVRGTRYESHLRWQIRTFWFGLLWSFLGALTAAILIGGGILFISYIWLIYRVAKGWLCAAEDKPILAYVEG